MIVIYHINNKVSEVTGCAPNASHIGKPVAKCMLELCQLHPNVIVVWCHMLLKSDLDLDAVATSFHHNKLLFSYHTSDRSFLDDCIGYVESSTSIKISKTVKFATWQMSSDVGAVHSSVILACISELHANDQFDYFLNSFAKRAMPLGLLCYSEPALIRIKQVVKTNQKASLFETFRFVKQHYKTTWLFLLMLNKIVYEKKFPVLTFLAALLYHKRSFKKNTLDAIKISSSKRNINIGSIDVIIPTIGRKAHLYNVLKDLAVQSHLPVNVIIVEQNPIENSMSELDYLINESWPFQIKHTFIHKTGVCQARNIALKELTSDWVFLADDDIRFGANCIEETLQQMSSIHAEAATINCIQTGEVQRYKTIFQASFFGSGCSVVRKSALEGCEFRTVYEFGYAEDSDFGMQLRNKGCDVIYFPNPQILHLKAPVGGFRVKAVFPWSEGMQPKPSPTVMLFNLSYFTKEQFFGYKTTLFLKYYKRQSVKDPLKYYRKFKKQWDISKHWAGHLKDAI